MCHSLKYARNIFPPRVQEGRDGFTGFKDEFKERATIATASTNLID